MNARFHNARVRYMSLQPFLPALVQSVSLSNLLQAVSHQEFVVACSKDRSRYVDKNGDPRVVHVGESTSAKEDCCHDTTA